MIFELFPLDYEEFLVFKGAKRPRGRSFSEKDDQKNLIAYERTKKMYEEYLSQKKRILNDIVVSYMEKDVRSLADFRKTWTGKSAAPPNSIFATTVSYISFLPFLRGNCWRMQVT